MTSYYVIQPVTSEPETATIISRSLRFAFARAASAASRVVPWEIVEAEKLSATKRAAFRGRE